MMDYIERIGEISHPNKAVIGGKTFWLDRLKKNGYKVAEGYCLSKELFNLFVKENNIVISANIKGRIFKYDEIRKILYKAPFGNEMSNNLRKIFNSLQKPLIIRSSAVAEDSDTHSCAGLFTSIGAITDFERFLNAIKRCWISSFNETIDMCSIREDYAISLLVQEELSCSCGGVAFSMNPISGNVNEMLIESSKEGPKQVVSGAGEIEQIVINKKDVSEEDTLVNQISKTMLSLEKELGKYVDIEWIYLKECLYILQVRPITTVEELMLPIIEVEDERTLKMSLNNLLMIHSRWLEKKIPVRNVCRQNNIKIGKFYYWFRKYDKDGLELDKLVHSLNDSDSFEIYDGTEVVLSNKDFVRERVLTSGFDVLRVGESVKTDYCGFSSIVDEHYYIELAKGGFTAFYSGEFQVTKYVVNKDGKIISSDEKFFEEEYYYNGSWWEKRKIDKQLVTLQQEDIKQIVHMTKCLDDAFSNSRVEWILNDLGVHLFDISVEKGHLTEGYGNTSLLSKGKHRGKIRILDDAGIFNEHISHVSVRMGYEMNELEKEEEIVSIKKRLDIKEGDIIVCQYPNEKLAVLLDIAKGFIFERGSLLCHFAIILRERKVPAVIVPNALTLFVEGQVVEICEGKVNCL